MKPLRAHVYEPHRVSYPCYVQPKLNGIRALYQNGRFQSNDLVPFSPVVTEHIAAELRQVFDSDIVLDGELYVHGWSLQRILGAITPVRKEQKEDTLKVQFHIFDVVDLAASFEERWKRTTWGTANEVLAKNWTRVHTYLVKNRKWADECYLNFVSQGYEGMIYRLSSCLYTTPNDKRKSASNPRAQMSDKDNRVWHMLKRKDWQDDEFPCIETTPGEGKHEGTLGALTCVTKEGKRFQVGSGFTDSERIIYNEWPPIGQLVKVKYLFLSDDGIPQNPSCLAVLPHVG